MIDRTESFRDAIADAGSKFANDEAIQAVIKLNAKPVTTWADLPEDKKKEVETSISSYITNMIGRGRP